MEEAAFLLLFFTPALGTEHFFTSIWVVAQKIHCGGIGHGSGGEILHGLNVQVLVLHRFVE